ncbi:hypothetical protein MYX07_05165 [Patescibacteria group bacterium AH-259-L07]|nr:hypothetical protein [Patescibacteria group bacterium AH-259-L07]
MPNKDKIPWYLAWIIGIIIFITWFFNLDYLWKGKQSADSFIQSIKEAASEVVKGFEETGQALQAPNPSDSSLPKTLEELNQLKEKVLQIEVRDKRKK